MQILPTSISEMKDSDSTFFIPLVRLYLKHATLYFALCDESITFDGQQYIALPVKIGIVKRTVDNKIDNTEVTISNVDDAFTSALLSGYDFRDRKIEIIDIPYPSALSDATQFRYRFIGFIDSPNLNYGEAIFKATVRSVLPSEFTIGRTLMLSCNNEFADERECFADKSLSTGTIQSGSTKTSVYIEQTQVDGYWMNGIFQVGYHYRKIKDSVGNRLDLEIGLMDIPTGTYTVQRHCNKTYPNCVTFGQQTNFTGFLGIPDQYVVKT